MILTCVTPCSSASITTDALTLASAMQNLPLFMQPFVLPSLFALLNEKGEVVEALGDHSLLVRIHTHPGFDQVSPSGLVAWLDEKYTSHLADAR